MKALLVFLLLLCFNSIFAQVEYEISKDPKNADVTIYRGTIDKYLLQNNVEFNKWFVSGQKDYLPDSSILNTFANTKAKLQFIIFGGTWCDDTQFILPKFFKIQQMANIPDAAVTLFGVNRSKQALGHIAEAFNITAVPTIIIMNEGKEIGRVAEYGKTGKWDKELADIIRGL